MDEKERKKDFFLPLSIVIAAVLISGAIIYSVGSKTEQNSGDSASADLALNSQRLNDTAPNIRINPISLNDHILGNPEAPVKVVEFSDLECPFCKNFHYTMKQVINDYAGKVVLIYRHFPLDILHSKARKEAEASECAAELGGNSKFWAYLDRLLEITPSNDGLDLNLLPEIAQAVGLDKNKFNECLASGRHSDRVEKDLQDAQNAGGRGTPYSIVISPGGRKYIINGALPLEQVKLIVDQALKD